MGVIFPCRKKENGDTQGGGGCRRFFHRPGPGRRRARFGIRFGKNAATPREEEGAAANHRYLREEERGI